LKELKRFCATCKAEKEIVEIKTDPQGEEVKLSCGHKIISVEIIEKVKVRDFIGIKHRREGKLLSRFMTKISRKTKRPSKDELRFDWEKREIHHKVWEQNEKGEWEVVHDEIKPFPEKTS